jgi:hypothetical protein
MEVRVWVRRGWLRVPVHPLFKERNERKLVRDYSAANHVARKEGLGVTEPEKNRCFDPLSHPACMNRMNLLTHGDKE